MRARSAAAFLVFKICILYVVFMQVKVHYRILEKQSRFALAFLGWLWAFGPNIWITKLCLNWYWLTSLTNYECSCKNSELVFAEYKDTFHGFSSSQIGRTFRNSIPLDVIRNIMILGFCFLDTTATNTKNNWDQHWCWQLRPTTCSCPCPLVDNLARWDCRH